MSENEVKQIVTLDADQEGEHVLTLTSALDHTLVELEEYAKDLDFESFDEAIATVKQLWNILLHLYSKELTRADIGLITVWEHYLEGLKN